MANGAAGNAKNVFPGGSAQGQNTVFDLPATMYIVKTFEMHQGCVFFDAESDSHIYFGMFAEMTKIRAIFHLCGWFETTPKGEKSPIISLSSDRLKKCASSDLALKNAQP